MNNKDLLFNILNDAPELFSLRLQDPASTYMNGLLEFNKHVLFVIISIVIIVGWLVYSAILNYEEFNFSERQSFFHSNILEITWTSLPALTLLSLASPSFALIYSLDEIAAPKVTLKVIGHQWFWSYEVDWVEKVLANPEEFIESKGEIISEAYIHSKLRHTCYLLTEETITKKNYLGFLRLLETNKRIMLPVETHIRLLVTSVDVLHSWAVPSFGVKIDACPGRLNQMRLFLKRIGLFFGQCSEICGVNHGFMPIALYAVSTSQYSSYMTEQSTIEEISLIKNN